MLAMGALDAFSQIGFDIALIQKKDDIRGYLDTAWSLDVVRGAATFTIMVIAAPWIASFFRSPESTAIVRAVALIPLLRGLVNSGVIYFQKDLEFRRQVAFEIAGRPRTPPYRSCALSCGGASGRSPWVSWRGTWRAAWRRTASIPTAPFSYRVGKSTGGLSFRQVDHGQHHRQLRHAQRG